MQKMRAIMKRTIITVVGKDTVGIGAIIGIVASIIVQLFVARFQTFHLLLYTASGFISCFVIGYLTSLFFKKK